MVGSGSNGVTHDFFIAHAGADKPTAEKLAALLRETGSATTFVDKENLLPGNLWPVRLAEAQERSRVTVVLVSEHTGNAYYELEEIAAGISQSRNLAAGHKVAPIYLEPVERIPYGLRILHGLQAYDDGALQQAAAQLLRLLPAPGDGAPKLFSPRIPTVTRFFTGRDDALARLDAVFLGDGTTTLTQAVAGMGGIGKTTVAAAYCDEQRATTDIVWWARAETETTLLEDLGALADALNLPPAADGTPQTRANDLRAWLERDEAPPWLLVLDNVEHEHAIADYVPRRGHGRVLLTTRQRGGYARLGDVVELDLLDPAASTRFLVDRVRQRNPRAAADPTVAAAVAERLGHLPLALEQAGAYLAAGRLRTFTSYLADLDQAERDLFAEEDARLPDSDRTATTTWKVSIDAAAEHAPAAARVMALLGWLAPEPFPLDLVTDPLLADWLDADPDEVTAAIEQLDRYSLLDLDDAPADTGWTTTITIHRVVQDAARRSSPLDASAALVRLMARRVPQEPTNPSTWAAWQALVPHAELLQPCGRDVEVVADWARMLDRAASFRQYSGDLQASVAAFERIANKAQSVLGPEHPDTLRTRGNLASSYRSAGRVEEAIAIEEDLLPVASRLLGINHPSTLTVRRNLASSYRSAGRITEAISIEEAVLAYSERVLGPDHPETLGARNNLGFSYWSAGRLSDAIALQEPAHADYERVLGPDHPDTLRAIANLAASYRSVGQVTDAILLDEAVLSDSERVLGPQHPDTLRARSNLAGSYRTAGRLSEAIDLEERVLSERNSVLGPEHPATSVSRGNLALTYRLAGRLAEAIALEEAVLADRERVFGPEHHDTLISRHNLAQSLNAAGRTSDALTLHRKTVVIAEAVLQPTDQLLEPTRRLLRELEKSETGAY